MRCFDCDHREVCGMRKSIQSKLTLGGCSFWKRWDPKHKKSVGERLADGGYENVVVFKDYSYDDALIGVSEDNRAVYDYDKMVEWLMGETGWSREDAIEWIDYNTIRAIMRAEDPIIFYPLEA